METILILENPWTENVHIILSGAKMDLTIVHNGVKLTVNALSVCKVMATA
jgi:hypothetical protein